MKVEIKILLAELLVLDLNHSDIIISGHSLQGRSLTTRKEVVEGLEGETI